MENLIRIFFTGALIVSFSTIVFSAEISNLDKKKETGMFEDDLLENLVGTWDLTGTMGKKQLHHRVTVKWILNRQFLQVHSIDADESNGENIYEALYFIGWNKEKRHYVMHLIDTFGGGFSETLGFGEKKENSILFRFNYSGEPFENAFIYDYQKDSWEMILKSKNSQNEWILFARKNLQRMKK